MGNSEQLYKEQVEDGTPKKTGKEGQVQGSNRRKLMQKRPGQGPVIDGNDDDW